LREAGVRSSLLANRIYSFDSCQIMSKFIIKSSNSYTPIKLGIQNIIQVHKSMFFIFGKLNYLHMHNCVYEIMKLNMYIIKTLL
jgi:hypothetical protein